MAQAKNHTDNDSVIYGNIEDISAFFHLLSYLRRWVICKTVLYLRHIDATGPWEHNFPSQSFYFSLCDFST